MVVFSQLLIGSSFVALVAFGSWVIGVLMGIAVAKFAAIAPGKHADVTDLLKRERQAAGNRPPAVQAAPLGTTTRPAGTD